MEQLKMLLSPEETCDAIGVKRSTLFKMLEAGEIPSIRIGRLRRIPVEELRRYIDKQVLAQRADSGQEA